MPNKNKQGRMEPPFPPGCRPVAACLDYRAFVLPFPPLFGAAYEGLRNELQALGRSEPPRLGVYYVYAEWGFLVVPPPGFPDLKIHFFHKTTPDQVAGILHRVASLIGRFNSNKCSAEE